MRNKLMAILCVATCAMAPYNSRAQNPYLSDGRNPYLSDDRSTPNNYLKNIFGSKKSFVTNINGVPHTFTYGQTTLADVQNAFTTKPDLITSIQNGGTEAIWADAQIDPDTHLIGQEIRSSVWDFDAAGHLISRTSRDDSGNQTVRDAVNKADLEIYHQNVKNSELASSKMEEHNKIMKNAETALLVLAGYKRCDWSLNSTDLNKANALIDLYRTWENPIDYQYRINRQGGTASIDNNEFCYGSKWHPIWLNALSAMKRLPITAHP